MRKFLFVLAAGMAAAGFTGCASKSTATTETAASTAAAFGIFNGMKYAFVMLAAIISIAAFICFIRLPDKKRLRPFRLCLVLITSGAVGNVIDRIRLGYVVDFIYFKPINFPVFNFADICVTCAAFLLIVLLLFVYKEEDLKDIPFIRDNEDKTKA